MESSKACQHLPKSCAQQALAGGLGGGIVHSLAADAGNILVAVQQAGSLQGDEDDSNGGEEDVKEDEPDNDDNDDDEHDQAGGVYVHLHFSYSKTFS